MLIQYGQVSLSTTWVPWTRPNLSSDGIIGGDSFAVSVTNSSGGAAYYGFDGTIQTDQYKCCWFSNNGFVEFYNPQPLKLQSIQMYDYVTNQSYRMHGGVIFGSNDGTNWVNLKSFTQSTSTGNAKILPAISVNSDVAYKYFKITSTSYPVVIPEILINALQESSALNTITLPTSYSNNYYGVAFSFISANSLYAYISSKTTSSISLSGVDTSSNSASWITIGY